MTPSKQDYGFCVDCNMFFDLWKYGSIEDAGHEGHTLRELTDEEYEEALRDCQEEGCFDE